MNDTTFFAKFNQSCGALQHQRPYMLAIMSVGLLCCGLASPWCAALLLVGVAYALVSRHMAGSGPAVRRASPWPHLAVAKGHLQVGTVRLPVTALNQCILCREAGVLMVQHCAHGLPTLPCLHFDPVYAPAVEAFLTLRLPEVPLQHQPAEEAHHSATTWCAAA